MTLQFKEQQNAAITSLNNKFDDFSQRIKQLEEQMNEINPICVRASQRGSHT